MEFSTQEPSARKNALASRWTGVAVFAIAVAAVLFYASAQEHDWLTLAVLCSVLLVGEILAIYQWYTDTKRAAAEDAEPRILKEFELRMKQSFANQEIIHKEVHANFEALSKQITTLENALKYLANLREQDQSRNVTLTTDEIEKIAEAVDRKNTGTPSEELADEIEKLNEKIAALSKEISEQLGEESDAIQNRIATTKSASVDLSGISDQLEAIAAAQDEILEKFETFRSETDDSEIVSGEIFIDEPTEGDDEAFPLPKNMFERAQDANAETVASAVSKLISDVSGKNKIVTENNAGTTLLLIEYFSEAPKPEPVPAVPEHRPVPEGELPLIEDLPHTALLLKAEFGIGERPYLRGKAPGLSVKKSVPMDYSGHNLWRFDFGSMTEDAEITIFRNDSNEALGEPFKLRAGKITTLAFSPNA